MMRLSLLVVEVLFSWCEPLFFVFDFVSKSNGLGGTWIKCIDDLIKLHGFLKFCQGIGAFLVSWTCTFRLCLELQGLVGGKRGGKRKVNGYNCLILLMDLITVRI